MRVNKIHGLVVFEETLSKCVLWSFEDAFFHSRSPENSRPIQAAQTFHSSQVKHTIANTWIIRPASAPLLEINDQRTFEA